MLTVIIAVCLGPARAAEAGAFERLFGYQQVAQTGQDAFPQWAGVLNRQADIAAAPDEVICSTKDKSATCLAKRWRSFLQSVRGKSPGEQLAAVNVFVNDQHYIGDQANYGREDYWALPGQLMSNGGDCEDFAIMKFFSLRKLGWPPEALRLVIVQDTKLRQQHAVLAVDSGTAVVILDNQKKTVQSPRNLPHYAPVVSMSDDQWWLHMPDQRLVATNR